MTRIFSARLFDILSRPASQRTFMSYVSLYRQRRALAALDDHLLNDLGLTKQEAEKEAERPVWDAPHNWKV